MLSKEFLDQVLKEFVLFDELSKKDPEQGLKELRLILDKAEKHKSRKKLDSDLEKLYKEYPLKFLKDKYPHIVTMLTSESYIEKKLQKFDPDLAIKDLNYITEHPETYKTSDDFKSAIEEWQNLYPIDDFNSKYASDVQSTIDTFLSDNKLEELFPIDLTQGSVIDLNNPSFKSVKVKEAYQDFNKIVRKNTKDINGLFNWVFKYSKYINSFDASTKEFIKSSLLKTYKNELPVLTNYKMPLMETSQNELLSKKDFESISTTKKEVVLQLLGMLVNDQTLSLEDYHRINIVNANNEKANIIKSSTIDFDLFTFMENKAEDLLTYSLENELYINPQSSSSNSGGTSVSVEKQPEQQKNNTYENVEKVKKNNLEYIDINPTPTHLLEDESNIQPCISEDYTKKNEKNTETEGLKKTLNKVWSFLNKDITPKKSSSVEIDRDDER